MFRLNALEAAGHFIKSLVPTDLLPSIIGPANRLFESILVEVDILERNRLRTDISVAEHILCIAFDTQSSICLHADLDATHCLTEIAGPEMARRSFWYIHI